MPKPTPITVLFPVYNASAYLKEAIDSILDQTFRDFQLLAINDGSTDDSVAIIESYQDDRIKLVHNEQNLGLIATLNKGIDMIESPYIVRADADDICLPERLEKQFKFMEANPEIGISGTWHEMLGHPSGRKRGTKYSTDDEMIRIRHMYQVHLTHGTSIIRKKVLDEFNLRFDPDFKHAEDYDLFVRMSKHCKMANIPEVLYLVRYHEGSVSRKFNDVQKANSVRVSRRQFKEMGIELSDEEIALYKHMAHGDFELSRETMENVRELFGRVIAANQLSAYVPREQYQKHLAAIWFHHCLNVKGLKQRYNLFKSASFHLAYPLSLKERAMLLLK